MTDAEIDRIVSRLVRMIGLGRIGLVDDSGDQQKVQLVIREGGPGVLKEVIDGVPRLAHYGLFYRPPDGAEAVAVFLGGRRSMGVVVATGDRATRVKDLEAGEVVLMNTVTGSFVKLCADGTIRSKGDWEHEGSFKATGDVLDHSAGNTATMKVHRDAYNAHAHGGVQAGDASTETKDTPAD